MKIILVTAIAALGCASPMDGCRFFDLDSNRTITPGEAWIAMSECEGVIIDHCAPGSVGDSPSALRECVKRPEYACKVYDHDRNGVVTVDDYQWTLRIANACVEKDALFVQGGEI